MISKFTEEQLKELRTACNRMKITPEEAIERIYGEKATLYLNKTSNTFQVNSLKKIIYDLKEQVNEAYESSKNY